MNIVSVGIVLATEELTSDMKISHIRPIQDLVVVYLSLPFRTFETIAKCTSDYLTNKWAFDTASAEAMRGATCGHYTTTIRIVFVIVAFVLVQSWTPFAGGKSSPPSFDYDLVIIGGGASGLFASGASTMLGSKTLLIDRAISKNESLDDITSNLGGDCTNAACVPSKAIRSIGRKAKTFQNEKSWLQTARTHSTKTVQSVRAREDPLAIVKHNPLLDIVVCSDCQFVGSHELNLTIFEAFYQNASRGIESENTAKVRSKKFLISTGSAPIVPTNLARAAKTAGVELHSYQSLLRPSSNSMIWKLGENTSCAHCIVIAGGGATGIELAQSLARVAGPNLQVILVAPQLLKGEDVLLRNAAAQVLSQETQLQLHLGVRLVDILPNRSVLLSDGSTLPLCDALVVCFGRSPKPSLLSLKLDQANVKWNDATGIQVKPSNLQSVSAKQVFASGDCCSAVAGHPASRTATHAAWTGYFAAINTKLPSILTMGSKSFHDVVPRVVYTDPELASIGMSLEECISKYGIDGFERVTAPTAQSDRADMEVPERGPDYHGFIELRAAKIDGKLLGMTACSPAASELANEMSVVLQNKLTAFDVAQSLHSYPSYGYMFHRVALAIAFSSVSGSLKALGTLGRGVAWCIEKVLKVIRAIRGVRRRGFRKEMRFWQAKGASCAFLVDEGARQEEDRSEESRHFLSFLDARNMLSEDDPSKVSAEAVEAQLGWKPRESEMHAFLAWLDSNPSFRLAATRSFLQATIVKNNIANN